MRIQSINKGRLIGLDEVPIIYRDDRLIASYIQVEERADDIADEE